MATYYVRKTGSDGAAGTSAGTAWLTIDKAANTVAAGDDVYVGAGVYREQVTMDTAGTSGNLIRFFADVDGSNTGDAGLVIITAFDDEQSTPARSYCVDTNEKDFIVWDGFTFIGGTIACVGHLGTGDPKYEGCVWNDCTFVAGPDDGDFGVTYDFNDAATPTGNGPQFTGCVFAGYGLRLQYEYNVSANRDRKILIENCVFMGGAPSVVRGVFIDQSGGAGSNGSVGFTVTNCSFYGLYYGVLTDSGVTSSAITVTNSVFTDIQYGLYDSDSTNKDAIVSDYNTFIRCATSLGNTAQGDFDRDNATPQTLMGGVADWILYKRLGWSPFLPFEPITLSDDSYLNVVVGDADSATAPATDLYGSARPMRQKGVGMAIYHFDASDAGPTDEGTVWTNDANAFNGNTANSASTSTTGSASTNRLLGEGTNAPTSGGTISQVEARIHASSTDATGDVQWRVLEDGGTLLVQFTKSNSPAAGDWSSWTQVPPPSGGWTWTKVAGLEWYAWMSGGTDVAVHAVQVRVHYDVGNADDRGPVEARALPEQETTTVDVGANAARLEGAGWHDWLVPVLAQSTTITVRARYDSNYTGSLPKMEVLNIPGVADKSDTMVAAANTWETLTSGAFTPTSDGVVRVRFTSQDTSDTGRAFFDAAPTVT